MFGPPSSEVFSYPYCAGPNLLAQLLVLAGYLAGPAAALAYGLPDPRSRILDIRAFSLRLALSCLGLAYLPQASYPICENAG